MPPEGSTAEGSVASHGVSMVQLEDGYTEASVPAWMSVRRTLFPVL